MPPHKPRGSASAWVWPLVGLVIGTLGVAVGAGLSVLGVPTPLAAGAVLATQVILTGALHEDGLADSADGLWGGRDAKRRLAIMKDSSIGSYGVLAIVFVVGSSWLALIAILLTAPFWVPLVVK